VANAQWCTVPIWGRKLGWMLTIEGAPWCRARVEKNRWPKVAGAATGFSEQWGSVVELLDVAAMPDGDWSELLSGRQQLLWVAPNDSLRRRSMLGAEGCGYLVQGHLGRTPKW
jgi:hypothetical protein